MSNEDGRTVPPTNDHAEIFDLMSRESALRRSLTEGFDNLRFLSAADDLLSWQEGNRRLLLESLAPRPVDIASRLVAIRADLLFHIGNYLASVSAGLDFLYNNGKATFAADLLTKVHERTTRLKKSPSHQIMTALRNRQLHSPPLIDQVFVQQRTRWHAQGEGVVICPVLTEGTTSAVEKKLPSANNLAMARWNVLKSDLECRLDWLTPLLDDHFAEVEGAFEDCKTMVRTAYADEVERYEGMRTKLAVIETRYKEIGLITP